MVIRRWMSHQVLRIIHSESRYLSWRYGVAVVAVALATGCLLALDTWVDLSGAPFLLFFGAVLISAWHGGIGPGLLATSLSACCTTYFFLAPTTSLDLPTLVKLALFGLEGGLISFLCGTLRNTNRQLDRSVKSLHQANQKISNILESITDAFVALDHDWRYTYINQEAERLLQTSRSQVLGHTLEEVFPELTGSTLEASLHQARTQQQTQVVEAFYPSLASWFEFHIYPAVEGLSIYFRNVSDRKQAEIAIAELNRNLQHRVDELQTLFEVVPLGIMISHDLEFKSVQANPTFSQILGITPQENASFTPPDQAPGYKVLRHGQELAPEELPLRYAALHGEAVSGTEIEVVRQDGTGFNLFGYAAPLMDEQGQPRGAIAAFLDITELKQAEAALRQSEERLRFALEAADMVAWEWDPITDRVVRSHNAARIVGINPEAIDAGSFEFLQAVHPQDQSTVRDLLQTAIAKKSGYYAEFRLVRPDGEIRWMADQGRVTCDDTGRVLRMSGVIQDITERKQAQQTLQERNDRLRLVANIANQLLLNSEPQALVESLFQELSRYLDLEVYFNYLVAEQQQGLQLNLYAGVTAAAVEPIQFLQFGQPVCGRVALQRQRLVVENIAYSSEENAQALTFLGLSTYASYPLLVGDRLLGTLAFGSKHRAHFNEDELALLQVVCDQVAVALQRANLITDLQQQTEKLAHANQIKDEFLAILSHELRTPMNPILGWSRLLQQGTLDQKRTMIALETIERNAKLQVQLIEDLLDVSRILQGKLRLTPQPINLKTTVAAAIETVQLAAEAKAIAINVEASAVMVLGDAARLQQVVWNLLTNAVKFTPPNGEVTIRLKPVGTLAQITVTDTGVGIQSAFLPHVFETFRQADSTTTRTFGGLGLGLAIVQQIVELHGGTITATSPGEGQGATFTVQLPLLSTPTTATKENVFMEPRLTLEGIQVLAVDDETDNLELVRFVLEEMGATVIPASSAAEALQLAQRTQPDILVTDIGMPEMDGYALLGQIRAMTKQRHIPAIALTAYAGESNQQQAIAAGFQQHLAKPIEPDKLVKVIADLMASTQVQ